MYRSPSSSMAEARRIRYGPFRFRLREVLLSAFCVALAVFCAWGPGSRTRVVCTRSGGSVSCSYDDSV